MCCRKHGPSAGSAELPNGVVVGGVVRPLLLAVAIVSLACGRLNTPGGDPLSGGNASAPPDSPLAAAVRPLAAGLTFQAYVPDLPSDLTVTASLVASPGLTPRGLGDPSLVIEVSQTAGAKPWLRILEGPAGCCPDITRSTPHDVTIRSASGGAPALMGQVYPRMGATEGPTLRWRERASGSVTEFVLASTTFGPYADEKALADLARSVRPLPRGLETEMARLYLSTHVSHSPTGHRVYVAGRAAPLPESARLVDASGATIATAPFGAPQSYSCLRDAAGVAQFAVAHDVVDAFSRGVATGYHVEVLVGGHWRPAQLIMSGCFSIE